MILKRELRSYQSSKVKSRRKAWTFDRGSWQQIEESRYNHVEEADGTDLEKAICAEVKIGGTSKGQLGCSLLFTTVGLGAFNSSSISVLCFVTRTSTTNG